MSDRTHMPRGAMGGALLLVLLWPTTPGTPAPATPPAPPDPGQLALLEELAHWVHGNRFELFADQDLSELVRHRRQSFELFRTFNRSGQRRQLVERLPYGSLIEEAAQQYRLDGLLLAAVMQAESGFDPLAVSPRGALGLMQLMPETGALYGALDLCDPRTNVRTGARYLRDLLRQFDEDLELALAAYNAGPGAVSRYGGVPPYRETSEYVDRVLSIYVELHRSLWRGSELEELLARGGEPVRSL